MADKDKSLAEKYAKDCGAMLSIKSVISNKTVSFMAFLNDYTDTFNSNWNTEEVFGRMDPVAMFKSTKRTLSIGWNVPSTSLEQAKKHRNKVARLSKMIYPAYNNSGMKHQQTLTKPPLVKVRYANLLRNTAGSGGQLEKNYIQKCGHLVLALMSSISTMLVSIIPADGLVEDLGHFSEEISCLDTTKECKDLIEMSYMKNISKLGMSLRFVNIHPQC